MLTHVEFVMSQQIDTSQKIVTTTNKLSHQCHVNNKLPRYRIYE